MIALSEIKQTVDLTGFSIVDKQTIVLFTQSLTLTSSGINAGEFFEYIRDEALADQHKEMVDADRQLFMETVSQYG